MRHGEDEAAELAGASEATGEFSDGASEATGECSAGASEATGECSAGASEATGEFSGGASEATGEFSGAPDLAGMRKDYRGVHDLDESWLEDGWEPLLRRWMHDAVAASVVEPNAMVLATVDEQGLPASRTVLCKGVTEAGIVFYSNYSSDKARHLASHPYASATFAWPLIGRQVTLRGGVSKVSTEQTARYWATRPRGSQLGAWASQQSRPTGTRDDLEHALSEAAERYESGPIPVPPDWGGYLLSPVSVEFWQGRANRMHNRIRTTCDAGGRWTTVRLQP